MDDAPAERPAGWAGILREVARGGLAGLIAGVIVGGVGGRAVMSIAALLNPGSFGMLTEADQVVGRFTLEGTLALLFFGGLGAGMSAGVVWVVIRPWLPTDRGPRWLVAMPVAVALGAPFLVEAGNTDFRILGPSTVIVALLLVLAAAIGLGVAALDDLLERRLPRGGRSTALYGLIVLLGIPALGLTLSAYLSASFSSHPRPFGIGVALLVVGLATALGWAGRTRTGPPFPRAGVAALGRVALVAAVGLGAWHLARETAMILAL